MRIALIGPAYPYRGGIAHHTTMLAAALRARGHEVDVITFRRQYPAILFPGRSQEEPEAAGGGEPGGERLIDSIDPLNWRRVGREVASRGYDLCIFKFWLPFFGPAFGRIAREVKRRGGRVMVVLENFLPHEPRPGDRQLTDRLFRYCDLALAQSSVVATALRERYPAIPQITSPHPVYENFGERLERSEARRRLGLEPAGPIIMFFGFIRRYKGLDLLLEAMPEIVRRLPEIRLLVVGEFYEEEGPYRQLVERSGVAERILIRDEYVPNDQVALWFSAADAVVLPYRSATNSGIVQIAYNFALPAVVTDVGSLSEVVLDGRTGYVLPDAAPATIASAVERLFEPGRIEAFAEAILEERHRYSWDAFAQAIERLAAGDVEQS